MEDTDEEFFSIANELISVEANSLLDRQLGRVRAWREGRQANGETADLRDLIAQVVAEPNKRGLVLAAYAAAMYRLLAQEGEL